MANFGLSDLVVVDPYEPIWKEARSAPGAEALLEKARAVPTFAAAVDGMAIVVGTTSLHQRPFEHAVVELPNMNRYLSDFASSDPLAIVFGSERSGLSNEELAACRAVIHIPTQRATPSMNLGHAVAVVGYELARSGWEPPTGPGIAPAQDLETLIQTVAGLGEASDYPPGYTAADRLGRIRNALHAARLPPATVHFLLSLIRHLRKVVDRTSPM